MQRDGANTSLWQAGIDDFSSASTTASHTTSSTVSTPGTDKIYDVLIVGGGITGVTTALQLQKAGKSCILGEAHTLCFGTTGGTTAHLNTFFDTTYDHIVKDFGEDAAQMVGRATREALDLYRTNVSTYGIDCGFSDQEGYVYSKDEKQTDELEKIFKATQKAGVAVKYADTIPVPIDFQKALVFPGQAQVHPTRYVMALAKVFEAAGGVILQQCWVNDVKSGDILEVQTSQGIIKARYLIYATHIPPGINLLHFRCAPYRSYAMAVTLKSGDYHEGLAYDMYDPYHYYRRQEVDGQKYLIVGGYDHKTGHQENTDSCFNQLEAHIRTYFDVDKVAYRWSSQYYEPSDGLAYIGHLLENPQNVMVATGFGGNGMTYSHIAALLLTGLIVNGDHEWAKLFHPGRVKPVAGFANFVKENADVVAQFAGKRLAVENISELAELAPGEGKVVKYEGQKVALYKGEKGAVHAINPVCTHAKCVVGWNSSEKSWDCPCHGARYSVDGEVLTGPARKRLEKIPPAPEGEGSAQRLH